MADALESRAGQATRAALLASIEHVLDQHAELRDVLTQIHGAADAMVLHGLLLRLDGLLETHFAHEEQPGGVLRLVADRSPRHRNEVERLVGEHRAILVALRRTTADVAGSDGPALVSTQARLAAILRRLHDHDARETEVLAGVMRAERSVAIERAAPAGGSTPAGAVPPVGTDPDRPRPPVSTALEVNLRRTAVDVVVPAEQMVLLEVTSGLHGLQEETRKLLREINHRYVGWGATLEDLHRHAMGTFPHYVGHDRAAEAVGVFCALYAKTIEEATPDAVGDAAMRYLLYYLEKLVAQSGPRLPALLPVLGEALERLRAALGRAPDRAAPLSPRLKTLARLLLDADPEAASPVTALGVDLVAMALDRVYARWLAAEDPAGWWREQAPAAARDAPPGPIVAVSHARLRAARGALEAARADVRSGTALLALPDDREIGRAWLETAACCAPPTAPPAEGAVARIRWLTRMLSVDALAGVHEQVLGAVDHAYADVLRHADRTVVAPLVRETFAGLRHGGLESSMLAFSLIAKIGRAVLATGDAGLADAVIDEILGLDFPTPGFAGFTDEWKVRVDPAHLAGIRCHLAIIEANPWLGRRLMAALVVHLRAGGVFIADTDLFQRDVSQLLGCDVRPVFHQLKHLLRTFPVYFSDIGAEGALRDVSTRIDEIGGRRDRLCNFLRKQCHVESNPRLIDFVEAIGRFWAGSDAAVLASWVPDALYEHVCTAGAPAGVREILARLAADGVPDPFACEPAEVQRRLDAMGGVADVDREKVALLVQLRALIVRKYGLGHDDLVERLHAFHRVPAARVDALERALLSGPPEDALGLLIDMLETLKEIAVDPAEAQPIEDIYHKRHIAVGIPSIYGRYREAKFEAMGLTFRIESLANVLLERLVTEQAAAEVDRATLERVARLLGFAIRALRVDGCRARQLAAATALLEEALETPGVDVAQYADVFRLLSKSIEQVVRVRFLDVYEPVLEPLLGRMIDRGVLPADPGAERSERIMKGSERLVRDLIAQSFALQPLDRLVGAVRRALAGGTARLAAPARDPTTTWDAACSCVPIDDRAGARPRILALGNKGYLITRLARQGFPVPPGFVLSTAYFRSHPTLGGDDGRRREMARCIDEQVARVERVTGRRFGDAARPLLLSVRSGAAISMPGMLDTFLDVGINPEIATGLAEATGSPWAAWDAYRRFLQFWGMSHGIDRDRFDAVMRDAKQRYLVAKKSALTPASMLEIALRYRALLLEHGVTVVDDPHEQLQACIDMVVRSWHSEKARAYRRAMQIADGWGTAVIVQAMVLGNLGPRSGTGVVLTCNPRRPGRDVELYGDFVVQGQGDDVVSGLVETVPISEAQRRTETAAATTSLEREFPDVYAALLRQAQALVVDHGMFHQEIEFTFEGERGEDLYVLQTRDMVRADPREVRTFVGGDALAAARAATGIGAGGGALAGRVAHGAADIAELRRRWPDDPIVLLRPDTVPDDIPLILQADGMVTAIGGATSHAAVAAQWLGRTCVVGCRALQVREDLGHSTLAGVPIATGEFLSIDGNDGSVYLGRHATTVLRRQRSG